MTQEEQVKKVPVEFRLRVQDLRAVKVMPSMAEEPSYDSSPLPFKFEIPPDGHGPGILASLDGFGDCEVDPIPTWKTQIDIAEQVDKYLHRLLTGIVSLSYPETWIEEVGVSLVQVLSIRIKHKKRINHEKCINPGDVYGTVEILDMHGVTLFYPYYRQQGDFKSIGPYDTLPLTGPLCFYPQYLEKVRLNLKDKDGDLYPRKANKKKILTADFPVSWDTRSGEYDTPIYRRFDSKLCSATMRFIVFSSAVQANVTVELVKKDGKNHANRVYGSIVARYSNDDYYFTDEEMKYWQNVLFYYPENSYVKVNPGKSILLLTSKLAVPTDSFLVIEAELWDFDKLISDGEIATGTVEFWPRREGGAVHEINGANGLLRVTVAWRS